MTGEVTPMLWYLLLVGFIVWMAIWGSFMAIMSHRRNLRALDILKTYAEKGVDPPPAVFETLARQGLDPKPPPPPAKTDAPGGNFGQFVAFGLAAALLAGLAWWWTDSNKEPQWLTYVAAILAVPCAAGASARLIAVFAPRGK